jgi:hypothetical protein
LIRDMLKGFFEEMAVHSVCVFVRADSENSGVGNGGPTEGALSNATNGILLSSPQIPMSEIIKFEGYQIFRLTRGFSRHDPSGGHSPLGLQR